MKLALLLGPYRNLTTLTASVLSLHPECQVLNHAADRLLADPAVNFFADSRPDTLARFTALAFTASAGGQRGDFGGSILHSHAFKSERLRSLYADRYGAETIKPDATCLIWKDSMRIQRLLMAEADLFERLSDAFSELRFILPIRSSADCAASNLQTGHIAFLDGSKEDSLQGAIDRVLDAHAFVLGLADARPGRVFIFTQHEAQTRTFADMANFLGVAPEDSWLADVSAAWQMRRAYDHPAEIEAYAQASARTRLARWPHILRRMGIDA
jgi:hypothetical protein